MMKRRRIRRLNLKTGNIEFFPEDTQREQDITLEEVVAALRKEVALLREMWAMRPAEGRL